MMLRRMLLASVAMIASGGMASAQTRTPETASSTPSPSSQPGSAATNLDVIVVTAQKRDESLNDVPLALSAYTSEVRQIVGLNTLGDFANFTPGLSYSASNDRVFLRGVGRQTNTAGSDAGVATYADGVYDSSTNSVAVSDFFIDRVEVLRGPQGTLYGRNSIGGAINAVSKRPTQAFLGEVRATIGNYDRKVVEAAISGPLGDKFKARLSGSWSDQDKGYFKNTANGQGKGGGEGGAGKQTYAELQLEADLTPDLNAWLKVFSSDSKTYRRFSNSPDPYEYAPYAAGQIIPGAAFGYLIPGHVQTGSGLTNPGVDDIRDFRSDTRDHDRIDNDLGAVTQWLWSLPAFDVKFVGGYRQYVYNYVYDLDYTDVTAYSFPLSPGAACGFLPGCTPLTVHPAQLFDYTEDRRFGSAELNLISEGTGPLRWIGGLYFYDERLKQTSHFNAPDMAELAAPANGVANPDRDYVYAGTHLDTKSYAAFGQVDYDLTDTLTLTGGLRYSYDKKTAAEALRVVCLGCAAGLTPDQLGTYTPALDLTALTASFAPAEGVTSSVSIDPVTGRAQRTLGDHWSAVSGVLSLQWRPDDDTLAYGSYSRGYKSGGFNAGGLTAAPETDPEYLDAFELGFKRTVHQTLQLNGAVYYYRYDGLQIPLTTPTPTVNITSFYNLDKAESYGAELEANWRVTPAFKVSLSYAYAGSKITSCCYYDQLDTQAVEPGAQPVGAPVAGQQGQSLDGEHLAQLPRNKVALNANYRFDFAAGNLTLSGTYAWRDKTYQSVFNRAYYQTPSFDQVDVRAVWTDKDDRFRLTAFAKNVFDTTGYDGVIIDQMQRYLTPPSPDRTVRRVYGLTPPRTFGLQLQLRFQ